MKIWKKDLSAPGLFLVGLSQIDISGIKADFFIYEMSRRDAKNDKGRNVQ